MKKEFVIVTILLTFVLLSGIYYAVTNSITSDEVTHITTGYINIHFNDYRFNIEHPPLVKQFAALPLLLLKLNFPLSVYHESHVPMDIVKLYEAFLFNSGNDLDRILLFSRIPNILIAVFLGLLIYLYSRRLNGFLAGVISLSLFAFSPSFLGNSPIVTMDAAVSCFYFGTIFFLTYFIENRQNLFLLLTGLFLGLSLAAKFSALLLIPVLYVLVTIAAFYFFKQEDIERFNFKGFIFVIPLIPFACSYKGSFRFIAPALIAGAASFIIFRKNKYSKKILALSALLLIILTIAFTVVIVDYTDFSWFPFRGATKAFCKGFSSFEGHAMGGQGSAYLLGKYSEHGWWYYFPAAFLLKEPFSFLIILLLGFLSFFLKKDDIMSKSLLLIPIFAYIFTAMFVNKVNIGIRHILPIYPFLYVIAGYCVFLAKRFKPVVYVVSILMVMLIADVLAAYPAHLSYFNRFVGGTDSGYKFLSDSNITWGQDWKRLKEYIRKNNLTDISIDAGFHCDECCKYYGISYKKMTHDEKMMPKKGIYVIGADELASKRIGWASRIKPACRVGGSLFIYNITDEDLVLLRT